MKLSCFFSSMEEKRIINPPLFMGFYEGRGTMTVQEGRLERGRFIN